jgi:hypothetical protein
MAFSTAFVRAVPYRNNITADDPVQVNIDTSLLSSNDQIPALIVTTQSSEIEELEPPPTGMLPAGVETVDGGMV